MLSKQLIHQQWLTYRPYIYKFYYQTSLDDKQFTDIIAVKWYTNQQPQKVPTTNNQSVDNNSKDRKLNFIIVGSSKNQCCYQGSYYSLDQYTLRVYEFDYGWFGSTGEDNATNLSNNPKSMIKQKKSIYYQKPLTCFQSISYDLKKSNTTSSLSLSETFQQTYYLVAIKNESIRIISPSKLAQPSLTSTQNPKDIQFINSKSPFHSTNIQTIPNLNLCTGNQTELGTIPVRKQITIIKYNQGVNSILCGCMNGEIILINLNITFIPTSYDQLQKTFFLYKFHTGPVRDLAWITTKEIDDYEFASISDDGNFGIWNVKLSSPIRIIQSSSRIPTSLIQVYPQQFIIGGKDCLLKFFDFNKTYSYTYNQNSQMITKLFNLTDKIQIKKNKRELMLDGNLRFVSCHSNGEVVFWTHDKEFVHLAHDRRIGGIDFCNEAEGFFIVVEKEKPKMTIFMPRLGAFLSDQLGF